MFSAHKKLSKSNNFFPFLILVGNLLCKYFSISDLLFTPGVFCPSKKEMDGAIKVVRLVGLVPFSNKPANPLIAVRIQVGPQFHFSLIHSTLH